VNIGLLAGTSYAFYIQPRLRRDTKLITSALVAALVLFSAETYATEACRSTPKCRAAERDIEERSAIYHRAREYVRRPGVLGGIVGLGKFVRYQEAGPIPILISGGQLTSAF
jgi:hypothetical protein